MTLSRGIPMMTMETTEERKAGKPWSIRDAAEFLGISDRHMRRLVDEGRCKHLRFGRRVLVPDAEVRRMAVEGEREPAAAAG